MLKQHKVLCIVQTISTRIVNTRLLFKVEPYCKQKELNKLRCIRRDNAAKLCGFTLFLFDSEQCRCFT